MSGCALPGGAYGERMMLRACMGIFAALVMACGGSQTEPATAEGEDVGNEYYGEVPGESEEDQEEETEGVDVSGDYTPAEPQR